MRTRQQGLPDEQLLLPWVGSHGGFTLLEIQIALAVLALAILGLVQVTVSARTVHRVAEERTAAREALESEVALIMASGLTACAQEAAANGTERSFQVDALDRGNPSGRVVYVMDETLTDEEIGVPLGMPRDLDGDGLASNPDISSTATLLPVLVRVDWTGVAGPQSIRTVVVLHRPRSS